jgi:two-component system chemotaxis sensor kinase CheA
MNEFLEQFCLESRELVDEATRELLALEMSPESRAPLDGAFRAFHTLKGCAGIVDFVAMSRSMHAAEEALSDVRQGKSAISAAMIGNCLSVIDQVAQWLEEIEVSGDLPQAPEAAADAAVARFSAVEASKTELAAPEERSQEPQVELSGSARSVLEEQLRLLEEEEPLGRKGRVASAARAAANVFRSVSRHSEAEEIERKLEAFLLDDNVGPLAESFTQALSDKAPSHAAPAPIAAPRAPAARSLRVDAERIDSLVSLTGELIVVKNAIAHLVDMASQSRNPLAPPLNEAHLRLQRLVGKLQETALNLRVTPLRSVFERFQRIVRELAIDLGKPTALVLEGEDTEADKAIVEQLFEPLLHIVRNAMDHGVEPAPTRRRAGKPDIATLRLSARREGEHVVIEVEDDGAGIDRARVSEIAAERGLIDRAALEGSSESELLELIFLPGFSTKGRVSELSGRGVGMDAVRAIVERMSGRVGVASEAGRGTRFTLHLPFSLMVTKVITIEASGQTFGLPLDSVVETVRVPRETRRPLGSIEAFVWRNGAVPLVDLADILGLERRSAANPFAFVVVLSVSGQFAAIEVDRLGEEIEVILKPVDGLLTGAVGIAGATVLGDGQVLLVLDVRELLA